ncbi:MAG: nuclear transport factor 2 family protein [Acidimicrobiales bacterium]
MAIPLETAVDGYLKAWNERDATARAAELDEALADDAEMTGPTGTFKGREAIDRLIVAMQDRMAGARIVRVGEMDGLTFAWQVLSPVGDVLLSGHDQVETAPDGRLLDIRVAL